MEESFLNIVIPPLKQPLTYAIPSHLPREVDVGCLVTVPLGSRTTNGYVISRSATPPSGDHYAVKEIQRVSSTGRCFTPGQLAFFQWIADYYGDPLSNVIEAAIPPSVPQKFERAAQLLIPDAPVKGKLQASLISTLREAGEPIDISVLSRRFKGAGAALRSLEEKGIIKVDSREILDAHRQGVSVPEWAKRSVCLSPAQAQMVETISSSVAQSVFKTYLLHGATGSGKTEVYIDAIQNALSAGRGALVIVPEIALTPQLIDRFRARLGEEIAILHSGLHRRVRWDSWRALIEGRSMVAIGARSAIFAPVPNLGLIIVDEEHDSSYKQSDGLRYNARDLATVRGKLESCPVVLGTATPSLESWHHAIEKRYVYLSLPTRHGNSRPLDIEIVDLNSTKPWEMPSKNVSPQLLSSLQQTLLKGEQAFLLYNRRGFASYLQCGKCDTVVHCPHCSVTFTYHQHTNSLVCHYCNLTVVPRTTCHACASANPGEPPGTLEMRGAGTEKILEEVTALLPGVEIERLDRDAASDIESYKAILNRVRAGETKILVGTQMIAKGHDLPNVTLVGIADCDVGLHMPDFRAAERVFQLLTQAAGRAGRGEKPGRVILQTRVPKHPALVHTVSKNFPAFANQELQARQGLGYPPFSKLMRIVASSQEETLPMEALGHLVRAGMKFSESTGFDFRFLGPAPAPLSRLKTEWRAHVLVKSERPAGLVKLIHFLRSRAPKSRKLKITFDLDPQDML